MEENDCHKLREVKMKRTIDEWGEVFGVRVLDPDGFDRTDPNLWERKFTKDEFFKGAVASTIMASKKENTLFSELDKWYKRGRLKDDSNIG